MKTLILPKESQLVNSQESIDQSQFNPHILIDLFDSNHIIKKLDLREDNEEMVYNLIVLDKNQ
jgi:hypothetical protein